MRIPKVFKRSQETVAKDSDAEALRVLEALESFQPRQDRPIHPKFATLHQFLSGIPGVNVLSQDDIPDDGGWWVKLTIDTGQPHAWNIVQELGHVLNELSITERLPTIFKPVSPPPYLNGGPRAFLSWVIECPTPEQSPDSVMKWLENRLPKPANELPSWTGLDR